MFLNVLQNSQEKPVTEFLYFRRLPRSSPSEVNLRKGVLKICSKFTGGHPCWSAISIILQSNFIEIALWQGCSPVNLLHFFRTLFSKNTSGWLLLTSLRRNSSTAVFLYFFRFFKDTFFFSIWVFLSRAFTIHRAAGEGGEGIYLTPLYHFNPLHRHLDISWAITAGPHLYA